MARSKDFMSQCTETICKPDLLAIRITAFAVDMIFPLGFYFLVLTITNLNEIFGACSMDEYSMPSVWA